MEYLKRLEDIDFDKIKERRFDESKNVSIFVMSDNSVIFLRHRVNIFGDTYTTCVTDMEDIKNYFMAKEEIRAWLYDISVLTKEEFDSYSLKDERFGSNSLDERRKKSIESKKKVLRKLMAEFPEVVKEVLEQNG
jgi:hypothetical protein